MALYIFNQNNVPIPTLSDLLNLPEFATGNAVGFGLRKKAQNLLYTISHLNQ